MLIKIPENIKDLQIIKDFMSMIQEYSKSYSGKSQESGLDAFLEEYSKDAVRYFLGLLRINSNDKITWDNQTINYYSELLYSVKGTNLVMEYLEKLIFPGMKWKYSPFPKKLEIEIPEIEVSTVDFSTIVSSFQGLLAELMYFEEFTEILKSVIQNITGTISRKISAELSVFNIINTTILEE